MPATLFGHSNSSLSLCVCVSVCLCACGECEDSLKPSNQSSSSSSGDSSQPADREGGIKWDEYNFPPCVHVIHFDLEKDDIPILCKQVVRRIYFAIQLIHFLCIINVISSIIFTASGISPGEVVFTSCLQLVIASIVSWVALYQGYRGLGGEIRKSKIIFRCLWVSMMIFEFVFMLVSSGHVHGFLSIPNPPNATDNNPDLQHTWLAFAVMESSFWLVILLLSAYCLYKELKYPGHIRARERALHYNTVSSSSGSSSTSSSLHSTPVIHPSHVSFDVKTTRMDKVKNDRKFQRTVDDDEEL